MTRSEENILMWNVLRTVSLSILLLAPGVVCADCVPGSRYSTVFNASRDLRKVKVGGIQYFDLKPNDPGVDATPRLNAAIEYVKRNLDCKQLVLDAGEYSFRSLPKDSTAYVSIANASNKSFDFRNASFLFKESYYSAFYIVGCNNCSISNFSIDYVHLPFTQLNVTGVSERNKAIVAVPQDSSWPDPEQLYKHQAGVAGRTKVSLYGFDTRAGIPQYGYTRWTIPHHLPRPHRIPLDPYGVIQKTDVFIVAARGGGPAIRVKNSQSSSLKDVTIHSSAGPGIEVWYSQGISLVGIQIMPGSNRLVSTVAGGIELDAIAGPGNLVQNSSIQGAQDDSIAGNVAAPYAVVENATETSITLCPGQSAPASSVFFVNEFSGQMAGDPLQAVQYTLVPNGPGYSVTPAFTPDQVKNVIPGAVFYNPTLFATGDYVTVENNQISNSYLARGIAFSGISGIRISKNIIANTQQAGIYVGSALPQNGPVNSALISENRLTSTNMGMSGVGTGMLGAIEVMSFSMSGQTLTGQPSQKIFITNNKISQTDRTGIWIANVRSGEVGQNDITGYNAAHGELGIDPHLNFGLESYAENAFQQEVLGWCTTNVSGTTLQTCNLELQPPPMHCLEPPAQERRRKP
jgi:Right handed beta helix region